MKKITFYFLMVALMLTGSLFAQNLTVGGVVVDKKTGDPLIGATVMQKGTSNGTVTDLDGKFTFGMPTGSVLIISYVGYANQEFTLTNNTQLRIQMVSNVKDLDEVVVVGYGTSRKRDLTGSIVTISGDDLKSAPGYNPVIALQGKVPGLTMVSSGAAGGSPTIRIRGVGTINAATDPLYVVDGMFLDNIDFLNPNDIESIEVLKDPSSLAIFGVQGANGVIIITTKKAQQGKLNITYDGYAGVQSLSNNDRLHLTNATQFTNLYNEQIQNMNPGAPSWTGDLLGGGTDWQNLILRTALITNHSITVTQSSEKASTVFSLGYFYQDGIVKYNDYKRYNGRWAGDYKVTNYLKVGGSATLSYWDTNPATASVQNAAESLPTYAPYSPVTDQDPKNIGSYYTPSPNIQKDVPNPVAAMEIYKGTSSSYGYRGVGNVYAEISFLKDFTLRATGYGDIGINLGSNYTPYYNVNNTTSISSYKNLATAFSRNEAEYTKYQSDFILNYNKKIGPHRIGAMAGFTARVEEGQGFSAGVDTLVSPTMTVVPSSFRTLNVGSNLNRTNSDFYDASSFMSYLTRASYSYADKYLATATFRVDGSSKFSPTHRWGYFPSIGLGWVMSEEHFMDGLKDKINFLKLKASWGQLGNDKIGDYLYFPTIDPKGQQVVVNGQTYYLPTVSNLVDQNIHWEVVTGLDAGFESQLFNHRLSLEIGYYTKTTSDLLAYVAPPVSVGAGYAITNAGSINNKGFEYSIGWNDKAGDFTYGISTNGATLNNKVLSLGTDNSPIISDSYHMTAVGHPIGSLYGYEEQGIFQNQAQINAAPTTSWVSKPGDIQYKDLNGDGKITDADRTFIGTIIPTFTYGISFNTGYKSFDLSFDFNGSMGNSIVNTKKLSSFAQFNYYTTQLNRWHGEGTSNWEPILDLSRGNNFLPSTNLLESGDYLRLRGVQLGYNLPKSAIKSMGISKFRIYVNAQNLFTFKNNSGYTPEVGGGILNGSVDNGSTYPIPSVYTAGLSVNF